MNDGPKMSAKEDLNGIVIVMVSIVMDEIELLLTA